MEHNSLQAFVSTMKSNLNINIVDEIKYLDKPEYINEGAEGKVYKCNILYNNEKIVTAIKHVMVNNKNKEEFFKYLEIELTCLVKYKHKYLTELIGIYTNSEDDIIYLIFRFYNGISLCDLDYSLMKSDRKLKILIKICEIVSYLHENKVIHRDLKPHNIILEENENIKLLDFGV